ncbi:MAG: hypothetical protein L0Z49_04535 [Actinobacteria bacterium]|nr:hypothetical protein [Actinomycetota bacterium]MCI0543701.1 hypothetical protein [Actinomycetota bacterium]MCI0678280.1 hypothetical protein [Actinomycetota bacterium]
MWHRAVGILLLATMVLTGCDSSPDDPGPVGPGTGAATPREAVDELVEMLNLPDFAGASSLAFPGQAALAALAEGATFGEVAEALREGDYDVAANFWAGFAQGTGRFLTGEVVTADGDPANQSGVEFQEVLVTAETGEERVMLTREADGHRVDLFASFGAGLASRMIQPVERLLTTQTDDARQILDALRATVPSLLVAAKAEGLSAEASQALTRLIELITRSV